MKLYICKVCETTTMESSGKVLDIIEPCILTIDRDDDYPLFCPYTGKEAKFKQKFPKLKNK